MISWMSLKQCHIAKTCLILIFLLFIPQGSFANSLQFELKQVGNDVKLTVSGSLDTSALSFASSTCSLTDALISRSNNFLVGIGVLKDTCHTTGLNGTLNVAPGSQLGIQLLPGTRTSLTIGLSFRGDILYFSNMANYVSGSQINLSTTFLNANINTLYHASSTLSFSNDPTQTVKFVVIESDTTAPTTSTATVSSAGTTVTMGMSETLNSSSTPAASAFAVSVDGTSVTPTAVSISGSNVALTLTSAVEAGSIVSVAYTKPSSGNVLEDATGNEMASFNTAGSITTTNSSTVDTILPTVAITGPTEAVTADFTATFTFSEAVSGFVTGDIAVTNGTKGTLSETITGTTYTLVVTPVLGTTVSISVAAGATADAAGNGNTASNVFEVSAGSPGSEFENSREDIQQVIVDEASRSLRSSITANQRTTQSARSRFISARQAQAREENVTRALIPFDVDGKFTLSEDGLSTAGNFFQQVGNEEGTYRRLFFGDFDVQHDADTDSTTATLTGRMAWEQVTSEQTVLGYFIGGELAASTIGGSFDGDQDRIGVTAGGYVVHELAEQVYLDGFASVRVGRNNLEMANDVLALESEYTTQTATLGGAITGVYSQKGYDFKPELAFSYGKTWLGDVGFTGRAYGLVDNALSLDAGDVSIASLTFRPEVIIPIGADFVADTNTQLSFAPRLVCEQIKSTTKTSDCGTGGELGFSSNSEDGMSSADMRVLLDRINGGTRSSFVFSVEHRF